MPVKLIKPRRFGDERGWFSETYNKRLSTTTGLDVEFVQDNHAFSQARFVLRGLHFQNPPYAQTKLIRCSAGAIWDVAVDIRRGSPTFGHSVAAELSAANGWQLLAPKGFAHGYLTLEPNTEVQYKVDGYYAPEAENGLAWDDEALGLAWPLNGSAPIIAARDSAWPKLAELRSPFDYDGMPLSPIDTGE